MFLVGVFLQKCGISTIKVWIRPTTKLRPIIPEWLVFLFIFLKACCSIVHPNANVLVAKIAKEIFHHIEYVNYLNIFNILLDFAKFILV